MIGCNHRYSRPQRSRSAISSHYWSQNGDYDRVWVQWDLHARVPSDCTQTQLPPPWTFTGVGAADIAMREVTQEKDAHP